ncbi:immunoglobulin-like domain-containing protein [Listeria booriae]|uniref:immunoglobulin-like domain-containing protein n=1 Tax=Listeria booriae TaxID=1552123 RepID=UPI0016287544|nr:immunoglobulin-like domain-containing protein [Listeria booriae]MBC1234829.1 hypothetical protein [Listeria booriae]MBC1247842.1 hypothetical protein [Listeria booriae]
MKNAGKKMLSVMTMTAIIGSGVTASMTSPFSELKAHASENEVSPVKPATPVLSTVITNETTEIKGTAFPGARILVQDEKYKNIATNIEIITDKDGNFTASIPKQEAGNTVLVFAKDTVTNQISISNYNIVKDVQVLALDAVARLFVANDPTGKIKESTDIAAIQKAQTQVDAMTDTTLKEAAQNDLNQAKAQLEATMSLTAMFIDGDVTGTITDELTEAALTESQTQIDKINNLTVKAELQAILDEAKAQWDAKNVVVKPDTPIVTTVITNETTEITGKSFAGAKILVQNEKYQNIATESHVIADENGDFTIAIPKQEVGDKVLVFARNVETNQTSISNFSVVKDAELFKGRVTPNDYTIGKDNYIKGTYTGDVKSIMVTVNGTEYRGGTITNGEFQFYALEKIKAVTDEVIIHVYNSAGEETDTKNVTLGKKEGVVTSGTLIAETFTLGDRNIVGTFTGDVAYAVVTINGETYKGGTFNEDGTFKFYAIDKIKSTDYQVTIQAFDKAGKLLDTQIVDVQK